MERILKYINNYYAKTEELGTITIKDNKIELKGTYIPSQYILVRGSILNDGIYKINTVSDNTIEVTGSVNEIFEGVVYALAIPKDIIEMQKELDDLESKYEPSVYQSEHFGNYSYSLATNKQGEAMSPFDYVAPRLISYRKIYETSLEKSRRV